MPTNPHLQHIKQLVDARLNPSARVWTSAYFTGHKSELAWIGFHYSGGSMTPKTVTHDPGIPAGSLVPEKCQRISDWICAQIGARFPDWFSSSGKQ